MGKQKKKEDLGSEKSQEGYAASAAASAALDPSLNALFQSSLLSSERVPQQRYELVVKPSRVVSTPSASDFSDDAAEEGDQNTADATAVQELAPGSKKKRKHKAVPDDVEGNYLLRLGREQEKANAKRQKIRAPVSPDSASQPPNEADGAIAPQSASDAEEEAGLDSNDFEIPQHESLAEPSKDSELEKADRTVFLSNVATSAITSKGDRRQLMNHLSSFFKDLSTQQKPPKIESLRFRSTAYESQSVPKKAAYAKKEVMDATTKSTNAYVVYSTVQAAREAVKKLNATVVLERHLRVDSVAHPSPVDNRRCVFVGNLGFVDDDSQMKAADTRDGSKASKTKQAGDVEEGLWRQFMKAGAVESVRVVRDKATRVGKGFAYVQFQDPNAVERALGFNDKRYPPLLTRTLRVTRAKKVSKTASRLKKPRPTEARLGAIFNPKQAPEDTTRAGRAKKLLGVAGSLAFEGHRARRGRDSKPGKPSVKSKGKPQTRSSRRGAAFKASGKR